MKKRIVSILVLLVLASSIVCSQAFVVDTKAVPSADGISKMIDGIKESAKEFKRTHIINEDGSRTELDKYKKPKNR